MSAQRWAKVHVTLAIVWAVLCIPTALLWADSVLWVGLISCYANAASHLGAWMASRADRDASKTTSN